MVFAACGEEGGGGNPGTGGSAAGAGGTTQGAAGSGQAGTGAAGTTGVSGSGGNTSGLAGSMAGGGGSAGSAVAGSGGGAAGTGGGSAGSGGMAAGAGGRGGSGAGGSAGSSTAGSGGRGGSAGGMAGSSGGRGGGTAGTGAGGSAAGSTGTGGMCVRDRIAPSEVLFIGDSFIALGNHIPTALQSIARAAGSLGQSETYRNGAVSGTLLGNGQIPGQYNNASNSSPVKVVLMDGGGNDCLQANNPSPAVTAATSLFQSMAQKGTESVVYFFYPDPLKTYANGSLKPCLDGLRPMMKSLCDGLTAPKCYFIDLRPGWTEAHTSDGIHVTADGGRFVAEKVWAVMQQNCIAQ
jgi:lysophospholipase L1-like esterase